MQNDKNCEVIDFVGFKHEMDRISMNPTERTIDILAQVIEKQNKHIDALFEIINGTESRISKMYEQLYEMFPDIEIIEAMGCESKDKRMKMYENYLNLNDDW